MLALSIGAQWPLLQSVAWVKMIVDYSAAEGLSAAVGKTFSGANPCKICKFVSESQQAQEKEEKDLGIKKLDLALPNNPPFIYRESLWEAFAIPTTKQPDFFSPPLSPPPKRA